MRAVQVGRFGGPEVLESVELPDPVAGHGQVVIDVVHSDVLYMETQLRQGEMAPYFTLTPPYVPGGAVGGRVRALGDGVGPSWQGRTVVARTVTGQGGYAERALADAATLTAVPHGLALRTATALLHDGPTAVRLFDNAVSAGSLRPGAWVLVTAAAGGLGALLVQLAKAAGARVLAAVGGPVKLAAVERELAPFAAFDYTLPGWVERVRETTGGRGVDVVFDGAGGARGLEAFETTAHGARFSAHGAPSGDFAQLAAGAVAARGVRVAGIEQVQLSAAEAGPLLERALFEAAAGRLTPLVGQTYPLAEAHAAHTAIAGRHALGKTLLTVE